MAETDNFYRIAYQLIAEYGTNASEFTKHKIKRYTEAHDYNALKAWYEIEAALNDIQSLKAADTSIESSVLQTTV